MKHTIATTLATLQSQGYVAPVPEFRFHARRWRVDYAWLVYSLAWEIEGLTLAGGRHQRLAGYEADCEKYNELILMGWTLIRTTPKQVETGAALRWLELAIEGVMW